MVQGIDQAVDITDWQGEEESRIFPVGTREKKLVYCPASNQLHFLEAGHRYLFKLSVKKCPEQFWIEIFAYRLGERMDVLVPPTFAAYDKKENQCGALIRWFLETKSVANVNPPADIEEEAESGGDLLQGYIPNFDQRRGLQHNFETISKIFQDKYNQVGWKHHWAKTFLFDALIGNSDRHQDNWGIIVGFDEEIRITPVFDNGTSMGYEIKADRFHIYDDSNRLTSYVLRGTHHAKWNLNGMRMQQCEFLKKYIAAYPETHSTMMNCLRKVDSNHFREILDNLTNFDMPVRFTKERANFMLKLLKFRHQMLLDELG